MDFVELCMILVIAPFVVIFSSRYMIKQDEDIIRAFYVPLRKKYTHSYIKQNKLIQIIRKRLRLYTDGTIHWMISVCHYLQLVMAVVPILVLPLMLFMPIINVFLIYSIVGLGPIGLIVFIESAFRVLQVQRCKKIKKTDPKYSKCEIHHWSM